MRVTAGYSTPLLHVADVARSIRFYRRLGFELIDVEGPADCPFWARMHCEGGALMFLLGDEPFDPRAQAVSFYLYTEDLPAYREQLVAQGIEASEIDHPEHMPGGEIHLEDPDGYALFAGHWSATEHEAWEASRRKRLERFGSMASSPDTET